MLAPRADAGRRLPPGRRPRHRGRWASPRRPQPHRRRAPGPGACDPCPSRALDAAILALLYGAGLRRAEAVAVDVADYHPGDGALTVRSANGGRERRAFVAGGAAAAVDARLTIRGTLPGPLLCPVRKNGAVTIRRLTADAVYRRLARLGGHARIGRFSPRPAPQVRLRPPRRRRRPRRRPSPRRPPPPRNHRPLRRPARHRPTQGRHPPPRPLRSALTVGDSSKAPARAVPRLLLAGPRPTAPRFGGRHGGTVGRSTGRFAATGWRAVRETPLEMAARVIGWPSALRMASILSACVPDHRSRSLPSTR